ncbi:hypothetical protein JDV02_008995 [Purpureocillium takamizusanense]|uniref:Uncharacterized protein n=1 Tax=Purpureocillium takamizusanense TaxID=2060973 RepID=A0A9Q8QP13_9HYPO|nr:uncharacterized protein JDV02_008995 [Purpureocillium takamizusanense]UNI23160.1 hypothetical protein JDV02_008995 [Purpureocillium takamizusanense]
MATEGQVCLADAPPRIVMDDIHDASLRGAARRNQLSTVLSPPIPRLWVRHRCGLDRAGSGSRACSGSPSAEPDSRILLLRLVRLPRPCSPVRRRRLCVPRGTLLLRPFGSDLWKPFFPPPPPTFRFFTWLR